MLVQALQQDQLDIMIGRIPDGFPALDLSFETLSEEALSIVVRPGHRAAHAPVRPKLAELAQYPWIIQPHPSPMRQIIDQTFRESRVAPPVSTVETSSILTTLSLLRDSDMLAVLPSSVAQYYVSLEVIAAVPTPLRGRLAPYGLILRKNRRISPATQLVIDAIRAAARRLPGAYRSGRSTSSTWPPSGLGNASISASSAMSGRMKNVMMTPTASRTSDPANGSVQLPV